MECVPPAALNRTPSWLELPLAAGSLLGQVQLGQQVEGQGLPKDQIQPLRLAQP